MLTKTFLSIFLCIGMHGTIFSAAVEDLSLEAQAVAFARAGYTNEADILARKLTNTILTTEPESLEEMSALVNVHLQTELYYAFNTKWGTNKARQHRIIYDFVCKLDNGAVRKAEQVSHITTMTVLSLAAQEYFWNEKSTVDDLKNRVRRELRYGLFAKGGHALCVSNLVHLGGDDLEGILDARITGGLVGRLEVLIGGFKGKTIGDTYSAIFDDLTAKFGEKSLGAVGDVPLNLDAEILDVLGLGDSLTVKAMDSEGDGMCGEHSLFIPTDGAIGAVSEGNGRYKILRAITDQASDADARLLYLLNSANMGQKRFVELMARHSAKIRETAADKADLLDAQIEAYQKFAVEVRSKGEENVNASRLALIKRATQLPALPEVFAAFNKMINSKEALKAAISTEKGRRMLRIVTNELMSFRKINPALEGLLAAIDEQISQIDLKAGSSDVIAQKEMDAATKNRVATRKDLTDFCEKYQDYAKKYVAAKKKPEAEMREALEALKAEDAARFKELEGLISAAEAAIDICKVLASNPVSKDDYLIEKYLLIGDTLKGFLNESMLPGSGHLNAFTAEGIATKMGFMSDFCRGICELVKNDGAREAMEQLMEAFRAIPESIDKEINRGLAARGLEIVEALPELPVELTPAALAAEMTDIAMGDGELRGWLPCDAVYTQLWAKIMNLNVFVFAGNEGGMTPPLDLMIRANGKAYSQSTYTYPSGTKGKNLATVIITSPTARNVFLNKGLGHYDKFICPLDYAAMAAELRHLEWSRLGFARYAAYPA